MIIDCCLLDDELDVLEMRLTELDNVVDKFVIVESPVTFQGDPKPLHFAKNAERFKQWESKLIVGCNLADPSPKTPWDREANQREQLRFLLDSNGARPDDLIMLSDVDEIPNRETVRAFLRASPDDFYVAKMRLFCFAINLEHPESWFGTVATRYRHIRSFQVMRDARGSAVPITSGGWHFTWLGTADVHEKKRSHFSHTELTAEQVSSARERRHHVDGSTLRRVDFRSEHWPEYLSTGKAPESWWAR